MAPGPAEEAVVRHLLSEPHATYEDLSSVTGLSRSRIARTVRGLRERGILKRVGSRKEGFWEVAAGLELGDAATGRRSGRSEGPGVDGGDMRPRLGVVPAAETQQLGAPSKGVVGQRRWLRRRPWRMGQLLEMSGGPPMSRASAMLVKDGALPAYLRSTLYFQMALSRSSPYFLCTTVVLPMLEVAMLPS